MPAQKRYSSNYQDEDDDESLYQPQHRRNQRRRGKQSRRRGGGGGEQNRAPEDELQQQQQRIQLETGEQERAQLEEQAPNHDQESIRESSEDDSDGSGTDPEDFDELISVSRSDIRGNVQCPICLGIIKRTRVVMGCQHRFCRECIDKSMRLGNNECPACRIHCASRRSLRDDPIFDAIIQAIYPDVEKYEEEELVFHEEERALNQQIQASIAQISQRQSEALNKRRKLNKDLITTSTPRGSRNYQNAYSRRRRNSQTTELHQSDHNESEDDPEHKSPTDEHGTQIKPRRRNRRTETPSNQAYPSPSAINPEDGRRENSAERIRENPDDSSGHVAPVLKPEAFTWGRGGVRSHVRHGSAGSSRNVHANRLSKLTNYLKSGQRNESQQDAHLQLVSLNVEETPSLDKPYLCCDSNLSINDIREHIAREVKSQANDIEIVSLEEKGNENSPTQNSSNSSSELQILPGQETLAGIQSNYHSSKDLTLGYMQKKTNICIMD
ncbi:PREDICTED: putative E3 ubiquitin-protein ligase RING1a isoform X2 [Ipomoea nil]|uniref:putative E3 ubiquitin-protein ligase RING1a isoform X2 n=1 Tax=Ipomoea nil TaxID=35883 RepID=UPI000901360D|nr:PREDICTED: putative E3 ubiquitin-protein ligase RING1a isoform X2 [Ipomoea nil]